MSATHATYPLIARLRLSALPLRLACLIALAPLAAAAAPPRPCEEALPLPLDGAIHGFATAEEPARYSVEIDAPGLMVIEAHGISSPPVPARVRFLDRDCRPLASNLPLRALRGRHVHRLEEAGTYFVEVGVDGRSGGGFRLLGWSVPAAEPFAERLESDPPREPTDEIDELLADPRSEEALEDDPPREPTDEIDELLDRSVASAVSAVGSRRAATWREIAGHGLLEVELATGPGGRLHSWCPWAERPELLETFTCARELRLATGGERTVKRLPVAGDELVALALASAGELTLTGELEGAAALFDARGELLAEPGAGEPLRLEAGRYYLAAELPAASEGLAVRVDLD